jgi:hypothetical protein
LERPREYKLADEDNPRAQEALKKLPDCGYLKRLAKWVRKTSFDGLLAAIFKESPEMAVNSLFTCSSK